MTTATLPQTEYKQFTTWQSVRKLANEIGVNFYSYSSSSYEMSRGKGIRHNSFFPDRIDVVGYTKTYGNNDYMNRKIYEFEMENFKLKFELWATKNNISYVFTDTNGHSHAYIQIVKEAN